MTARCLRQSIGDESLRQRAPDADTGARSSRRRSSANLGRKLASVTGAAGAAITGEAVADTIYVPAPGVVAARNIPGFTYVSPTNITLGELRPPASLGVTPWDVDGNGTNDFGLINYQGTKQIAIFLGKTTLGPAPRTNVGVGSNFAHLKSLGFDFPVPVGPFYKGFYITQGGTANIQNFYGGTPPQWTTGEPHFFGFSFTDNGTDFNYGWGSMTIDLSAPGQGFKITEAYYQAQANFPILVGQVPVGEPATVPELSGEPSGIALLAAGALWLEAWRNRRRREPAVAG